MKKSILGIIAISSMAMVSCTQEVEQLVMDDMKNVEFTGTIEDVDTRNSMDNTGKVIWCENDPISIFMRNGNHYKYQANEGGTANTAFVYANWYAKGSATLDQNYAVYPFDESNAFDASTKKFTVDLRLAEQTYTENNFEEGKSVMTAKASDTKLPFYNALSMLKVKLHSDVPEAYRIKEIKIESKTLALSGEDATIDLSGEDGRVAAVLASGDKSITLDCGEEGVVVSTEPTDFYILVPANSVPADDFTITITAIDEFTGNVYTKEETIASDFTFERSKIVTYGRPLTANSWTGSIEDVIGTNDIVMKDDHAEVSTANGLLKWAYIANNKDNTYGLELMNDIEMPALEIEEDDDNETYKFTEKAITVNDGVPSGSNWIPITMYKTADNSFDNLFKGNVDGNNHEIKGLRIIEDDVAVGFIGFMEGGAKLENIKFVDALICNKNQSWGYDVYGDNSVGVAVGRSQNGTLINNVEVANSIVKGYHNVGGIVGMNYRRAGNKYDEKLALVTNCSTDANTKVIAYNTQAGGVCGKSYGAAIIGCVNNADVEAGYAAGGIVGCAQEYLNNVNVYVIACGSTSDAEIKAGGAGGLIGINTKDTSHEKGFNYIVACYSESKVSGNDIGTMIGESRNSVITASWAVMNGPTDYAGFYTPTLVASNHYLNSGEITNDIVNAMNQAITGYNETVGVEVACPYTWSWTSGSWPVLVKE